MPPSLLLDLTHTSHTNARTGVQRVARSLAVELGGRARPICHDPYLQGWRYLEDWERVNLATEAPAAKRGAHWPWRARLRGYLRRVGGAHRGAPGASVSALRDAPADPAPGALLVPEFFSPKVAGAYGPLFERVRGPRVALFYDAIALRLPELTPTKTVARFPSYLQQLLRFDAIAAISDDSRQTLVDYWAWLGVAAPPPVVSIPLAVDLPAAAGRAAGPDGENRGGEPTILCVSTIEGRKNHLALLEACEALWARGLRFELHLVGLAQEQTGRPALDRIATLQAAGRPLRYDGPVEDAAVTAAYRRCAFTVYPSLVEGFGLPVIESLAYGRACVCSGRGALGEAARGGGCVLLPEVDGASLAGAIAGLLADPAALARLGAEARARRFKTWAEYARELEDWIGAVSRR
jgi:glycosyltransferase involved in cell wall biosynthesis